MFNLLKARLPIPALSAVIGLGGFVLFFFMVFEVPFSSVPTSSVF
jgi:hypothetical protein